MSNPFENQFDSECQNCGEKVEEGEMMYAFDGEFWCESCMSEENICECGNYKKEEYDECYDCHFM